MLDDYYIIQLSTPVPDPIATHLQLALGQSTIKLSVKIRRQEIARPLLGQLRHHVTLRDVHVILGDARDLGDLLSLLVKDRGEVGRGDRLARVLCRGRNDET